MAKKQYTPPRMQKATREEVYRKERLRIMNSGQSDRWQRRQTKKLDRWFNQKNPYKNTAPKQSSEGRALQSGSHARSRRVPCFSGTVGQFVSLLLLVALLGTVFIAYDNSQSSGDPFYYFSPSAYLAGFNEVIYVPEKQYILTEVRTTYAPPIGNIYRAYVDIDGRRFESDNIIWNPIYLNTQYKFTINGVEYVSYDVELQGPTPEGSAGLQARAISLPGMYVEWLKAPEVGEVLTYWKNISDIGDLGGALGATADFIGEFLTYQKNLLTALLPWNSLSTGSRDYLHSILPPLE